MTPLTLDTPLAGRWEGGDFDLLRRVRSDAAYTRSQVVDICRYYRLWGERFGLRADVAFAQMLFETGGLRFGGQVGPEQYNLCGLKTRVGPGFLWFASLERGVIAHYAHLAAYAFPEHTRLECSVEYDPRHPTKHWAWAHTIADLSGRWSPEDDYSERMLRRWNI